MEAASLRRYEYHFSRNLVGVAVSHAADEENVTIAATVFFATIFPLTKVTLKVIGTLKV